MVIQFIILDLNEFDKYEQGVIFLSKAHNYTKKKGVFLHRETLLSFSRWEKPYRLAVLEIPRMMVKKRLTCCWVLNAEKLIRTVPVFSVPADW